MEMCCRDSGCAEFEKDMRFQNYFRALHCPSRWRIIRIIGEEKMGTGEIMDGLRESGETLARSSLYYHLSELEKAGIIEMAGYREEGGGAPEKTWRLKTTQIRINLLNDIEI
ncbi:MAG: winged helix-turn-helix domain-containing protein [Candidatus Bathyarchaeota archaeon]|jgi:DNA-binding transcriptional ArsR family regulator